MPGAEVRSSEREAGVVQAEAAWARREEPARPSVSVPCAHCAKPIVFRDTQCPACGARVPPNLRRALEDRLEASDADFRALKDSIRSASMVVILLGLLYVGWGVVLYLLMMAADPGRVGRPPGATAGVVVDLVIGAGMFVCAAWCRKAPSKALVTALAIWVGVQLAAAVVFPLTLFSGWLVKIIALVLLPRGIYAAFKARSRMRQLEAR